MMESGVQIDVCATYQRIIKIYLGKKKSFKTELSNVLLYNIKSLISINNVMPGKTIYKNMLNHYKVFVDSLISNITYFGVPCKDIFIIRFPHSKYSK